MTPGAVLVKSSASDSEGKGVAVIIRKTFPQVYALESPKRGKCWLVSARSAKWGLNERKTFPQEELALKYARDLEAQVIQNGRQSDVPKEEIQAAASYERLVAKLSSYGRTPEEAVNHFLVHLGNEAAKGRVLSFL